MSSNLMIKMPPDDVIKLLVALFLKEKPKPEVGGYIEVTEDDLIKMQGSVISIDYVECGRLRFEIHSSGVSVGKNGSNVLIKSPD